MAPAPEATTEFPTSADGNACLTKNWAKAAGLVVAAAAMWLIVIAILIAV
jgi:hypothetical protein